MISQEYQPLAIIATTPQAAQKLQPLSETIGATLWIPPSLNNIKNAQVYQDTLKNHITSIWEENRAFIFCLAIGAVVRIIAPLLKNKHTDPAVIVLDQELNYAISLCSSHLGGADKLTRIIAQQLGATPIITGAAVSNQLPGIDILGVPFGWVKGTGNWTEISAAIARFAPIQVIQEAGTTLWQENLPPHHPFYFGFPENHNTDTPRIWISPSKRQFSQQAQFPKVQWHPRVLWIGIGCERGTSKKLIHTAIAKVCQRYHLAEEAIAGIATIDIKADEKGILELCNERQYPLKTFSADKLNQVQVPNPSNIVQEEVGTPSVAEAAAILACMTQNSLLVPKQIVKEEGEKGAVTVAIAQADREYTGRLGKLLLVGIGPGKLEQITPAAQTAIVAADAIIGYSLYIELILPLTHPGQIIQALPITQERERAQKAIELAQWGLTVCVISSGDSGIYGMAGLVLEQLHAQGWDGKTPQVEVFPGITAANAAAARVGAPLMHDFCTISLSDLLTPIEVIEKRLEAAAVGDFVTAIYNPKSQTRTQQIKTAQETFLKHRSPDTPVALVKSAYREEENIQLTTLDKMLQYPIDMLTTVIIGNSSTFQSNNWMITPRGYQTIDN